MQMCRPIFKEDNMSDKLLSHNPITGKKTFLTSDLDGLGIKTEVNVDPVLDLAKAQETEWRPNSLVGNTQKHQQKIAEIPAPLFFELQKKFGDFKHNKNDWLRWLSDPETKYFRTTGGKLI